MFPHRHGSRLLALALLPLLAAACRERTDRLPDPTRYSIVDGTRVGYIDAAGTVVVPAQFDGGHQYLRNDLAAVRVGERVGFIDGDGRLVINPRYHNAGTFSEGLAAVADDRSRWGYVNAKGAQVIAAQFTEAGEFRNGLAPVAIESEWGYTDREGVMVIPAQFAMARPFQDGRAGVQVGTRWGVIDTKGRFVVNPIYDDVQEFSGGLAVVRAGTKYGYIDRAGTVVIAPSYEAAGPFGDRIALVQRGERLGIIGPDGGWRVQPTIATASADELFEQLAWTRRVPRHGRIPAVSADDRCGYLAYDGTWAIEPTFADCAAFEGPLASVLLTGPDARSAYLDRDGTRIWETAADPSPAPIEQASGVDTAMAPAVVAARAQPATGRTHTVLMRVTDEGEYTFAPAHLTIRRGDAVRWVMESGGPHNVNFEHVQGEAAAALSANMPNQISERASMMFMNPGEEYTVSFAGVPAGTYDYTCLPHVALGMTGRITVVD